MKSKNVVIIGHKDIGNLSEICVDMQIENLILEFSPTMLLVEHDKTFIEKIGTSVKKM